MRRSSILARAGSACALAVGACSAPRTPHGAPPTVVCVGDDSMQGRGLPDPESAWPSLLREALAPRMRVVPVALEELEADEAAWASLAELRPALVVLQAGAVDARTAEAADVARGLERLRAIQRAVPRARVLALAPDAMREACAARGAEHVELAQLLRAREPGPFRHERIAQVLAPRVERAHGLAASRDRLRPMPSVEYRGHAAGWGRGVPWRAARAHVQGQIAEHRSAPIVLLGDSITQALSGHRERLLARAFGGRDALSLGLSGDRCEHLLWRIESGELDAIDAACFVVMIGVNDIVTAKRSGARVAADALQVLRALVHREPAARVLFVGCLPAGVAPDSRVRREVLAFHAALRGFDFGAAFGARVRYRDLTRVFVEETGGALGPGLAPDGIHLNARGAALYLRELDAELRAFAPR